MAGIPLIFTRRCQVFYLSESEEVTDWNNSSLYVT